MRKKKKPSGLVSVQVIDKSSGKYKVLQSLGSSDEPLAIEKLVAKAEQWIKQKRGLLELDFDNRRYLATQFLDNIQQITVTGS